MQEGAERGCADDQGIDRHPPALLEDVSDPEIMGGTPVFVRPRVPLQNLIDCLEDGESIEDFLDGFPSVKREHVIEDAKFKMLETV